MMFKDSKSNIETCRRNLLNKCAKFKKLISSVIHVFFKGKWILLMGINIRYISYEMIWYNGQRLPNLTII